MFVKSSLALAFALCTAATAAATPVVPNGTFKGKGHWLAPNGANGDYSVQVTVQDGKISNVYDFNGQVKNFEMSANLDSSAFFSVQVAGKDSGTGYCQSVQCHYSFSTVQQEETLTFYGGKLYRLGSKDVNGLKVSWEEVLQ
jgi:hypothetical protein